MHVEADEFFIDDNGKYEFDATQLPAAHEWCLESARQGMLRSIVVIVSNTFAQNWEMDPYKKLAARYEYDVNVIECQNNFGSVHGVPEEAIQRTRDRREPNREQEIL